MNKSDLIRQTAHSLFAQYGWKRISVDEICQQANVSRVTFYKHFKNKKVLLMELLETQKNETRARFEGFLAEKMELEDIIKQIFLMHSEVLQGLYSQPMLSDFNRYQDSDLQQFFAAMEQEKYQFMHHFFSQLQQRKIIQHDFPIDLIDIFIRKIDELIKDPLLIAVYQGKEPQLHENAIQLLMHGIAYKKDSI